MGGKTIGFVKYCVPFPQLSKFLVKVAVLALVKSIQVRLFQIVEGYIKFTSYFKLCYEDSVYFQLGGIQMITILLITRDVTWVHNFLYRYTSNHSGICWFQMLLRPFLRYLQEHLCRPSWAAHLVYWMLGNCGLETNAYLTFCSSNIVCSTGLKPYQVLLSIRVW